MSPYFSWKKGRFPQWRHWSSHILSAFTATVNTIVTKARRVTYRCVTTLSKQRKSQTPAFSYHWFSKDTKTATETPQRFVVCRCRAQLGSWQTLNGFATAAAAAAQTALYTEQPERFLLSQHPSLMAVICASDGVGCPVNATVQCRSPRHDEQASHRQTTDRPSRLSTPDFEYSKMALKGAHKLVRSIAWSNLKINK